MNPLAPYWGLIKNGLLIGVLVWFGLFCRSCGKEAGDAEVSALKAAHAQTLQGIAEQTAKAAQLSRLASEKFRERENQQAQRFVEIATTSYLKGKTDAQASANAVADDLRAGNRQLRHQWLGCVSASRGAPASSAGAGGTDDAAELRAAGVGRVLGIVGACDAHVEALQATLKAERSP